MNSAQPVTPFMAESNPQLFSLVVGDLDPQLRGTGLTADRRGAVTPASVAISKDVRIGDEERIRYDSVLCLAPDDLSKDEMYLLDSDTHFLKSCAELTDVQGRKFDALVVFTSGHELVQDLLQCELLNIATPMYFHFRTGLSASLERLGQMGVTGSFSVIEIRNLLNGTILKMGPSIGGTLDVESFHLGARAMQAVSVTTDSKEGQDRRIRLLEDKLLGLLKTVGTLKLNDPVICEKPHASDAAEEHLGAERRYAALERKYNSLASSLGGRLTLRLWGQRREKALALIRS